MIETTQIELPEFYSDLKEKEVLDQVTIVTDILMRILAGREMVVAFNACLSTLNTIAQTLPENEKLFVAETLCDFAESLIKNVDDTNIFKDIELQ